MTSEQIHNWISKGPNVDLINSAEKFGQQLKDGELSTSQIRQVFTKLKNIESKGINAERLADLLMLKPFISYAAGRQRKAGLQDLKRLVCEGIDQVATAGTEDLPGKFRNFVKLFEAVLAYHRACGGK